MNQMTQNRCGGVPVAHIHKHDNRLSHKHLGAMLLLLALMGFGGKALGQTWNNGANIDASFYGHTGNVTITIDNSTSDAIVYIIGTLGIYSGWGQYYTVTIQPASTSHKCIIQRGSNFTGEMFHIWAAGPSSASWFQGHLIIKPGITIDGNNAAGSQPIISIEYDNTYGGTFSGKCEIQGSSSHHVEIKNNSGSPAIMNRYSLDCDYCDFTNNTTTSNGGAIYNENTATLTCNNCTFENNTATSIGGAIYNTGVINIDQSTFTSNSSQWGAVFIQHSNATFQSSIQNTTFHGNSATNFNGGAICKFTASGTLTCNNCTFGDGTSANANTAGTIGGAIYNVGPLNCTGSTFNYNTAPSGGALASTGVVNIVRCNFSNNQGTNGDGGAIHLNHSGNNHISDITLCNFTNNSTTHTLEGKGGAVYFGENGTLNCKGDSFGDGTNGHGNTAKTRGGAIYSMGTLKCITYTENSTSTNCAFTYNKTTATAGDDDNFIGGGAIYAKKGTMTCTNCDFSHNTSAFDAGAIYIFGDSGAHATGALTNCNFNYNDGSNGGAIANAQTSTLTATSCTFDHNISHNSQINNQWAGGNGGAIFTVSRQQATLTSCTFTNNQAMAGGCIYATENLTIDRCDFHNNEVISGTVHDDNTGNDEANHGLGGALFYGGSSHSKTATIKGGSMYSNTALRGWGGAIYADHTSSGMQNCILSIQQYDASHQPAIYSNRAAQGGGVYAGGGAQITMSAGSIHSNMAKNHNNTWGNGGGVNVGYVSAGNVNFGGVFTFTGGTIGGSGTPNSAANGGGVFVQSGGTFNMIGTTSASPTLQYNTATTNGGGVYQDGTMNVHNVVVIKNNTKNNIANNVYLNTGDVVNIDDNGLLCGSSIGINNATDQLHIAEGTGTNSVNNAQFAYRNGFFFQDANTYGVSHSNNGAFAPNSTSLYFVNAANIQYAFALANGATSPNDYTGSTSGGITAVKTLKGLALLAKDVYDGYSYNNQTVTLENDITISGNWEPIGYRAYAGDCSTSDHPFKGTFNGQGHSISGISSNFGYQDGGLFGYVEGGTIKNVIVASGNGVPATENVGGIVGYLNGGAVYNCMAAVTPTGGTNLGALVGKIANSGSLYNSFANSSSPLVGNNAGTVANCYVRGASSLVTTGTANYCYASSGSASGTNGTFSAVETTRPYSYNCFDNQVTATNTYVPTTTTANPDKQLVTTLNNWVAAQNSTEYAGWVRPTTPRINGDYPVLKMPGSDAVASNGDGNVLHYGSVSGSGNLLSTYTTSSDAICLYNSVSTVASNSGSNAEFYINEDVAIGSGSSVNAHVGITLKDAAWHMFSPAIAAAPLGITYTDNTTDYGYNDPLPQVSFNNDDGYFPKTNISGGDYYDSWDYYCYFEPQYHWINFKRNGNSHHHEDGNHEHIDYKATPSASVNVNETTLIPAKGYLLGTKLQTFLQSEGTLNDDNVSIALTSQSPLRTGYNFIGNPYQAYLDFDAFAENTANRNIWEGGNVTNASYVILESSGYMSYVHGASNNHFGADRYLHPHQGFMVVVKNGATSATFTNDMRSTTNTAAFRGDQVNYPLVNLIATEADGKRDITTVELGRPDQGGALKQYDLHLGKGSIYTHYGDDDYAIAFTQPGISEVGIRFETDEDATYTLSWDTENGEFSYLHLIDNITGIDTDCLTTSEYRFAAKTSDYKSRFKLVFGYTGVEENEDGASTGSATFAFMMGNELVVNCGPSTSSGTATLQMFDLMGRMMMERHVSGTQTSIMMPDMPAGVYVLRLSGNNGTRTQKIVME